MSNKMYTILATFEAKPGKERELEEVLSALIAPTLKEPGCINYDLHKSLSNPAEFMFHENWKGKAAHVEHCETPHIKAWQAKKDTLLAKPYEVTFWEMTDNG